MTAIDTNRRDIAQFDTTRRIDVSQIDVAKLAQDKGCTLKMQNADDAPFYWVENGYFISRPFCRLTELKAIYSKITCSFRSMIRSMKLPVRAEHY